MNRRKLTIEEFNELTSRMKKIIEEYDRVYQEERHNPNFPIKEYEEKVIANYLELQNELLSYDLSKVPFEAWKEIFIISGDGVIANFTGTYANIDFEIFMNTEDKSIFKTCNIRNIDKYSCIDEELFDNSVLLSNPTLFLSLEFPYEFRKKYYNYELTIEDVSKLSSELLEEFKSKIDYESRFDVTNASRSFIESIGFDKTLDFYNKYPLDYKFIADLYTKKGSSRFLTRMTLDIQLNKKLKECDISEIKRVVNDFARDEIIRNTYYNDSEININDYPESFIKENDDLFMTSVEMSSELREKIYKRRLEINDIVDKFELFKNLQIHEFMIPGRNRDLVKCLGAYGVHELMTKHELIYHKIMSSDGSINNFISHFVLLENFDMSFTLAVKKYFLDYYGVSHLESSKDENGKITYAVPEWLSSIGFNVIGAYTDMNDITSYNDKTILYNTGQTFVIENLNLEYLKRFDQETGYFSRKSTSMNPLNMEPFVWFLKRDVKKIPPINSYEDFTDFMAYCLEGMRIRNYFTDYPHYDYIEGDFREKYEHIFISREAPEELRSVFYSNRITPSMLHKHREYIPYLLDMNLKNVIKGDFFVFAYSNNSNTPREFPMAVKSDFIECYSKMFGNKKLLELLSTYGGLCENLSSSSFDLSSEETMNRDFRRAIYRNIVTKRLDYRFLSLSRENGGVPEFVLEYPDIFIDDKSIPIEETEEKLSICQKFYEGKMLFEDFYRYPQLKDIFKTKNIRLMFGEYISKSNYYGTQRPNETDLVDTLGAEKFLNLCSMYGRYLEGITEYNSIFKNLLKGDLPFEELTHVIEDLIADRCEKGILRYLPEDAPLFLKEKHPELFLDEDAPDRLKELFYYNGQGPGLTFVELRMCPEWLPYLEKKKISASFLRKNPMYEEYFRYFSNTDALKLGMRKSETVTEMIKARKVGLMYDWYLRTGKRFVPDYVVMQSFPIEEADKFLTSASNWSSLMKVKSFSEYPEGRDALLKLAYSFGVFDQDKVGLKKLQELITGIPRHLTEEEYKNLLIMEQRIIEYKVRLSQNKEDSLLDTMPLSLLDYEILKSELIAIGHEISDNEPIFDYIFHENDDKSATLKINPQSYSKIASCLRKMLESEGVVLSSDDAHRLFGGFEFNYDKDFREFLLANLKTIRENPEYTSYVAAIQRHFTEIKTFNSNRHLTLDLAISFIQSNKYENILPGNERVAELSAIAGYTQSQFDTLQKIYAYGRQRTFSSIPRIENHTEEYSYEILRLDDPLAMAIGTLTDCCQELGNAAELCMEHSMVDKNGRVFVIRDDKGNIVAQSWVWRNKGVLCFDNIEIPDKAFSRASKNNIRQEELADKIYEIYKKAAKELILEDERVYRKLLEEGKITEEEYDGLRLGKITVGTGYNDIAASLQRNAKLDVGKLARPLYFEEPVRLQRGLYTNDSNSQYVLEAREDRKEYRGDTLPVHSDSLILYTDETFNDKNLLALQKLEIITKNTSYNLCTTISDYENNSKIVTELAYNYDLDPYSTKIIMNPNFAIIYDETNETIRIGDLLYNTNVVVEEQTFDISASVIMQIRMALEQIAGNKKVDVSMLNEEQKEMYNKAMNLRDELDAERGVRHAK